MSLFNFLRKKKTTANVARERLQIIISHERQKQNAPNYLPQLQQEILDVISKYVDIDKDQVKVQIDKMGDHSVLELNVTMPDELLDAKKITVEEPQKNKVTKNNFSKKKHLKTHNLS